MWPTGAPPIQAKGECMRRIFAVLSVFGMMSLLGTVGVSANDASNCGAVHGAFANANGDFGFLGQDGGSPGYHDGAVGQDPGATGFNNSTASQTCSS